MPTESYPEEKFSLPEEINKERNINFNKKRTRKDSRHKKLALKVSNENELETLCNRVREEAPPCKASLLLDPNLKDKNTLFKKFSELPISNKTLSGLKEKSFFKMTDIQKNSIPHALAGRDILGAAKTGSGKTLAFLIPLLENLHRNRWSNLDGLGALIVTPTRELALQIFEVLKLIGKEHQISAGLVIGGVSRGDALESEKRRVTSLNIIVGTPGRILHHMDETFGFDCGNLQMLILDEADRLLEAGFEQVIKDIVQNLPKTRQTLLFSATQTRKVDKLAALSLISPEIISPHEASSKATPSKLMQQYIVIEAHEKLNLLLSFLRSHSQSKIMVFFTTRKQARFAYEMFRRLSPGIPLSCIHGKQKQNKRMNLFEKYLDQKVGCLLTTDICSRGLDIKDVDWVVNFDCPPDVKTYIHRVGRTARYKSSGFSLLFLLPSEVKMVEAIRSAKIPIAKVCPKRNSAFNLKTSSRIASFVAASEEKKHLAQKAFVCYVRSIAKKSNKDIFDLSKIDLDKLCHSMGLNDKPIISSIKESSFKKNLSRSLLDLYETKKEKTVNDENIEEKNQSVDSNKEFSEIDK